MTESLFDLGIGDRVVGITDYCVHPVEAVTRLPRVGGTKNPRVAEILDLQPDLVLANWEENTREPVEALEAAGIPVWVTFPQTVQEAVEDLWKLAGIFPSPAALLHLKTLEQALEWAKAAAAGRDRVRFFCPIWLNNAQSGKPWFMTFNEGTYCHDLLETLGGENIFSRRERRYPLAADLGKAEARRNFEGDTRYPRISVEEILAADPEIILLPDEPFPFDAAHQQQIGELFAGTQAVQNGRVFLVDGSLITWHGTRMGKALQQLPALLE